MTRKFCSPACHVIDPREVCVESVFVFVFVDRLVMSFSSRSYSKEARSSSSYYARSSSYHASSSNTGYLNSSSGYALTDIDRPLSTRLIERDYSLPSLAWDFDDPFFFDRYRWRFGDDLFRLNYGLRRAIPITYRTYSKSSSSIQIPVQYQPSISFNRRRHVSRRSDNDSSSSLLNRQDESSMSNRSRCSCFHG